MRTAVDQCAEVGFEMIIMTFGSGFDAETADPDEIARIRALAFEGNRTLLLDQSEVDTLAQRHAIFITAI